MLNAPTMIATACGAGFLKPGPGSWGSGVGVLLALPFVVGGYGAGLILLALLISVAGLWAIPRLGPSFSDDDPRIVIDEVAGMALAMLACGPIIADILFAFVVFRALDILKPWPINACERVTGAKGILLDDSVAGALTTLIVIGTKTWML